jgi:hypothetical protein
MSTALEAEAYRKSNYAVSQTDDSRSLPKLTITEVTRPGNMAGSVNHRDIVRRDVLGLYDVIAPPQL